MMDDEQRAGDVLAGPGSAAAIGRRDRSRRGTERNALGPGHGGLGPEHGGLGPERDGFRRERDGFRPERGRLGPEQDGFGPGRGAPMPGGSAHGAEDDDEVAEAEAPKGRWSLITEMVVLFAVALAIALLIKTFVVQPFFIPSASMENTLLIGDKVLVNKVVYRIRPISRGDIVVFNGAGSWLPPTAAATPTSPNPVVRLYDATLGPFFRSVRELFGTAPGQTDYIKRVIGIPGDHVSCCNAHGDITVNGVPLHEQSYLFPGSKPSQGRFSIVVPPGRLWVMGDNRDESADSRLHDCAYTYEPPTCVPYDRGGTVPEDKVIGRAFMIVWPPSRFRILPIPSTFEQAGLVHVGAARSDLRPAELAAGTTVRPSGPYLPLAGGLAAAVPVTLLEWRLRLRVSRLRRARRLRRRRPERQQRHERPVRRRG